MRQIREERGLTQLYVAKVVGVTTDTISRWENNRYPSIKRSNALRLAEALETDLEKIILSESSDENVPPLDEVPALEGVPRRKVRVGWAVAVLFLLAGGLAVLQWSKIESFEPKVLAVRQLPNFAAPQAVFPVIITLEKDLVGKGFILREKFPDGWQLKEANPPPSSLDNVQGVARWIIKPGEMRDLIVYILQVSSSAADMSSADFHGEVVLKGDMASTSSSVTGDEGTKVGPYIWADENGDGRVDDAEMLNASDVVETMQGVHLNWTQLEKVWDAGGYFWDDQKRDFKPQSPKNGAFLWLPGEVGFSRASSSAAIN